MTKLFSKVPHDVAMQSELNSTAVKILNLLCSKANNYSGECQIKIKTLANFAHLSPRTIQRAITTLQKAGYISIIHRFEKNGRQKSSVYKINFKEAQKISTELNNLGVGYHDKNDTLPMTKMSPLLTRLNSITRISILNNTVYNNKYTKSNENATEELRDFLNN